MRHTQYHHGLEVEVDDSKPLAAIVRDAAALYIAERGVLPQAVAWRDPVDEPPAPTLYKHLAAAHPSHCECGHYLKLHEALEVCSAYNCPCMVLRPTELRWWL